MGLLDGILDQFGAGAGVEALAAKVGIPPALAETAIAALGQAHPQPGDTVTAAAAQTGIDAGTLGQIVEHLGGESTLGKISGMLGGSGGLAGLAGGLLGGKD